MTDYGALGEIPDELWQAVADRFGLGRVLHATPLTGGLFGKNVELGCDAGRWVLRGMHRDEVFGRERFFAEQIAERSTLGAPWPYQVDDSGEILPWTYSVMRHVGGEIVTADQDRDWDGVAVALGRAAAALHEVAFPAPAEWRAGGLVAFDGSQREWLEARTAGWIWRLAEHEPLDPDSERWLTDAIATASVEGYEPTLVHHDLTVGNTRFSFDGDTPEATGVFDLQECYVGDPDEDLARSLWQLTSWVGPGAARAFLDAYRRERPARPGEGDRLRAFVMCDLLVIWEFGRRDGRDWFGDHESFRGWASGLLEPVEPVAAGP